LLGKQQGFAVGPTVNPCTKGIYIWGKPITLGRQDQEPLNLLLVDTEGIGSIQQDQTYDVKIFSLAILLSSYFVYNSMSIIDERALDGLSLVVNLTQQITAKSTATGSKANGSSRKSNKAVENGGDPAELAEYFPHFLWLLRDFALDLVDERGAPITSRQYLENALRERPEAAQQSKNGIRSAIKQLFRERDCVTLVRPVVDEKQLKTIDSIPYNNLRAEFREQSDELVQKIFDEAPVKQIHGQNLTGETFAQLIHIYTDAINAGAVASIQSAWDSLSTHVNQSALDEAFHAWTSGINAKYNPNRPLGDDQLQALHMECMNEAFGIYDAMSYSGGNSSALRKTLKAKLLKEYDHLVASNREASTKFVLRLLHSLYEPLEAQSKNGSYKSMESLLDAWVVLKKNYFESLGDHQASKLVAYDEFIKFFTSHLAVTTTHVTKFIQEGHVAELDTLKKKLDKLTSEKHASELAAVKAVEEAKRLTSVLATAEKRNKELESDIVRTNVELKEVKTQAKDLQQQVTTAQGQRQALQTQLNSTQDKLNTATSEANKASKELIKLKAELKSALDAAQTLEAKLTTEAQKSTEEIKKHALELKRTAEENKKLLSSWREEKNKHEELSARTKKDMETSQAAKEAEKSKADRSQAALRKELEEAKKASLQLQGELEAAHKAMEGMRSSEEETTAKYRAEVAKNKDLEKKHKGAQANAEAASADRAQLALLQSQITKLQTLVGTTVRERDAEKADKDAIQGELEKLHQDHVNEVASLTAMIEEHSSEITALKLELQAAVQSGAASSRGAPIRESSPATVAASPAPKKSSFGSRTSVATPKATSSSAVPKAAAAKASTSKKSGRVSIDKSLVEDDYPVERMDEDIPIASSSAIHELSDDEALEEDVPIRTWTKSSGAKKATAAKAGSTAKAATAKKATKAIATRDESSDSDSESESDSDSDDKHVQVRQPAKVTKKVTAAKKASKEHLSDLEEEDEEREPIKAAKRAAKAATPAKKAPRPSLASTAMDIDDLPAAPSRKRSRPSDFSETAEVTEAEATPSKAKKQANDPTAMDKGALKSALTAAGVKLPPGDNAKSFYVDLYNKHLAKKK
jgi:predicted  nucleic acid-binding Zn-ribbon protein